MVRQLGREIIEKYSWLERANITMGYSANLLFDFADLDDLCKNIEGELDSHSLGAGFSSQGQRIDEFVEHRSALLSYTSDVLYDIDEYLENPLYKGFNNAVDLMAAIDMRDAKTDNTIGLQEHTSMYVGAGMYDEVGGDMTSLNLEDFIGSRNKNNSLTNYQKVDDFAELFAKDYENLVNNDKIDPSKVNLQEYLDSLVLKEFAHKKDAPFWKELLESLSEMTVVIPIIEAATGKTLITGDYLTGDERAFKVVSGAVSLVTLGYGAAIAKGGGALAKMFAADILAEAVSGSTVIVCDKAGVPSAVTVALAIVLGSTTGVIADKALLKNGIKVTGVDEIDSIKDGFKTKLDYVTSNGLELEATPGKTTTVLGTYKSDTGAILDELGNVKSLDFGPRDGGFNLLNTPDELYVSPEQFWMEYNKPWLDNVIARDDIVKIATEPTWDNLTRINRVTGKTELTGFGREYTYLKQHGYKYDAITKIMSK